MPRRLLFFPFLLLVLSTPALAQRLATVLPAETVFALGVEGLAAHSDKLDDIVAEAERLELGLALQQLFGMAEDELDMAEELPVELEGIDLLELLGNDAWLAVSVSSFNPLPAVTVTLRTSGDTTSNLADLLEKGASTEGAELLSEGNASLYLFPVDGGDAPFELLAVGQLGDVFAASTNPDVLRGVFRRLSGSAEAGFAGGDAYRATLGRLGEGNSHLFIDYQALATSLSPLGAGNPFEVLIGRALSGLSAFGKSASVTRIREDGFESQAIRIPGEGDQALASLMAQEQPASQEPLSFVPPTALVVSVSLLDLPGWWGYLGDLARSSDELGNPDLNELAMQFTGIDLHSTLFSWMGSQAGVITGKIGPVQPGVPGSNLLGANIYLLETTDEAAASQGLATLFGMASTMVAGFADPSGMGAPGIEQRQVGGAQVTSYGMGPGITVAFAVKDGWVLIATSDELLDEALTTHAAGGRLPVNLRPLAGEIPANALAYSLSDLSATLAQTGAQMSVQLQTLAGISGEEVDFDALDNAGAAIEEFFTFLAQRAGGAVGYTVAEPDGVRLTHAVSEFDW